MCFLNLAIFEASTNGKTDICSVCSRNSRSKLLAQRKRDRWEESKRKGKKRREEKEKKPPLLGGSIDPVVTEEEGETKKKLFLFHPENKNRE